MEPTGESVPSLPECAAPHTTGVGCLYLKDLDDVDLEVLEGVVAASYRTVTAGTYPLRAREGRS